MAKYETFSCVANSTRMQVRFPSVKVQLLASGSDGFGDGVDGTIGLAVVVGVVVALVVDGADVVVVIGATEELLVG